MELINKRGIFFSIDALIAVTVIVIVLMVAVPLSNYIRPSTEIHRDLIESFSSLKIGDTQNAYVQSLIAQGKITDLNDTILEQIGEFYVTNITLARELAQVLIDDLNVTHNIGIWYQDKLIASKNSSAFENAENIETAREIISGIAEGSSVTGYSARAFLSSSNQNEYFYFGGYIGDGNITAIIDILGDVTAAEMELAINNNFELFVNGISQGNYPKSDSDLIPRKYTLPITNFVNGENTIEFKGINLHIAGGFIKISYDIEETTMNNNKYHFPGINGLINIYDGFYVPGDINSMDITLHLKTNFTAFLVIGNTTIYNNYTDGEEIINISDSVLSSILDYNFLSKKTVPIRLGLENVSYIGTRKKADVFSVTDISGSMDGSKLSNAKLANYALLANILNYSGNKVGLAAYNTIAEDSDFYPLSEDNESLYNEIQSWIANGYTCICCGINKAIQNTYYQNQDNTNELLAYLKMENDVLDISGKGNNGTSFGSPLYINGINGSAIKINSTNYISLPSLINSDEGSISLWVNLSSNIRQTIFDASSSSKYFYIDIDGSRNLRFQYEDINDLDINDISYNIAGIPVNRSYHHIAVVWRFDKSPAAQLYFDGILIDQDTSTSGAIATFLNPYLGRTRSNYGTTWTYSGSIDEFRVYSKALNSSDILALNNTTPTCTNDLIEVSELCDNQQNTCDLGSGVEGLQQCNSQCSGWDSCIETQTCGDGAKNSTEQCDDGNTVDNDDCSANCIKENRLKTMIVMSDGQANMECAEQNTGDPALDAYQAACEAYHDYNITVYAVGFGADVDTDTLEDIAQCGGGDYYYANIDEIVEIYKQIASNIINALYQEQTINATENVNTILYPDSKISFGFDEEEIPYGAIITLEKPFNNNLSGTFLIPDNSTVIETVVVSYSGPKWTHNVEINNNSIYYLVNYGTNFISLGDPYQINIPNSYIDQNNTIDLTIGVSLINYTDGSSSNKIISTIAKEASTYSNIAPIVAGCNWTMEFEDYTNISLKIPANYTGSDNCFYTTSNQDYDPNDAVQNAVYDLLKILDLEPNNKINSKFNENNLEIELTELSGIPYVWSTEVHISTWY